LMPPDSCQIWLAMFRGHRARRGNFTTHYLRPRSTDLNGFQFYVATFVAGHLAFHSWRRSGQNGRGAAKRCLVLTHDPDWDRAARTLRIWPTDGTQAVWPPTHCLSDCSFADRGARQGWRWNSLDQRLLPLSPVIARLQAPAGRLIQSSSLRPPRQTVRRSG